MTAEQVAPPRGLPVLVFNEAHRQRYVLYIGAPQLQNPARPCPYGAGCPLVKLFTQLRNRASSLCAGSFSLAHSM